MKNIITYGEEELSYLSKRDRKLGKYIGKLGYVKREGFDDVFSGLCYSVINQQISMKAADRIFEKIRAEFGEIVLEKIPNSEMLFGCGLSHSKADCLSLCAEHFRRGELSAEILCSMSDEEIMRTLTKIKGIGAWTAEMIMIFCLGRPDILSLSDFGIRKGLSVLHGINMKDISAMKKYKKLYSPYGTTASIYLWEISKGDAI